MLGVATGCLYKLELSLEEEIEIIKGLGVDGIEITFSSKEEVYSVEPGALSGLKDHFDHVSLHAPITYDFNDKKDSSSILRKLELLRAEAGASCIIFHPPKVESLQQLRSYTVPVIENMQERKNFDRSRFEEFIDEDIGLVIDTCHAATWSLEEAQYLLERYRDRISHVHLSAYDPTAENYGDRAHQLIKDNLDFLSGFHTLLKGKTVILENKVGSVQDLEDEVKFVKENFDF